MLSELPCTFQHRPIVIGGQAMAYYGLREAKDAIDLVVHPDDFELLLMTYSSEIGAYGDECIKIGEFEIYNGFFAQPYEMISHNAVEYGDYLVASLPALLYLAASHPDGIGRQDVQLIMVKLWVAR